MSHSGSQIRRPSEASSWLRRTSFRWSCARQAHDHLNGVRRSHELASLGRRICEPEWDMLQLIKS